MTNKNKNPRIQNKEPSKEIASFQDCYDHCGVVKGSHWRNFNDLQTNVSSRPGFGWSDYHWFRGEEEVPTDPKGLMGLSNLAYKRVGVIRNTIDLMADFVVEGVRVVHENGTSQRLAHNWWTRINGMHVSERYCNNLLKMGTVVINKKTGKFTKKGQSQLKKILASADQRGFDDHEISVSKREIPIKYTFISPQVVDLIGDQLANFTGKKLYSVRLPLKLKTMLSRSRNKEILNKVLEGVPPRIMEAAKSNQPILLDPQKTIVDYYKKDDWESWGSPITECILDDVKTLFKLKLADRAALDGATSNIRIIKIGDIENNIVPNEAAFTALQDILESNVGGGTVDIIWGPDIDVWESNTNVHEFLGREKYEPTLISIYSGLGIPPTLTGFFGGGSGATNNFVALKTFTRRLVYLRKKLIDFWNKEFVLFAKAMGMAKPPRLEFDYIDLEDENAFRALLIQLSDRGLISDERLQIAFDHDPEMENSRLVKEAKGRENKKRVPKAGPWHSPEKDFSYKKIALQTGLVNPAHIGVEVEEDIDETTPFDLKVKELDLREKQQEENIKMQKVQKKEGEKSKDEPGKGRPRNSKDKEKRKKKEVKPSLKAAAAIWAKHTFDSIAEKLNPGLLNHFNKKNMRSLNLEQVVLAEKLKFGVLCEIEPFTNIQDVDLEKIVDYASVPSEVEKQVNLSCADFEEFIGRSATLEEIRHIQFTSYIDWRL